MRAVRRSWTSAQERCLQLFVEATAELMQNLDEIEGRLDCLESVIRAPTASSHRAQAMN